jgi:hypothetical protein
MVHGLEQLVLLHVALVHAVHLLRTHRRGQRGGVVAEVDELHLIEIGLAAFGRFLSTALRPTSSSVSSNGITPLEPTPNTPFSSGSRICIG